jgi:hypothetical protein
VSLAKNTRKLDTCLKGGRAGKIRADILPSGCRPGEETSLV